MTCMVFTLYAGEILVGTYSCRLFGGCLLVCLLTAVSPGLSRYSSTGIFRMNSRLVRARLGADRQPRRKIDRRDKFCLPTGDGIQTRQDKTSNESLFDVCMCCMYIRDLSRTCRQVSCVGVIELNRIDDAWFLRCAASPPSSPDLSQHIPHHVSPGPPPETLFSLVPSYSRVLAFFVSSLVLYVSSISCRVVSCVQVTVMSAACAERCGLASRIDKRFAGRAVGVGFARILGRIHDANIR